METEIRRLLVGRTLSYAKIAAKVGVDRKTVMAIAKHKAFRKTKAAGQPRVNIRRPAALRRCPTCRTRIVPGPCRICAARARQLPSPFAELDESDGPCGLALDAEQLARYQAIRRRPPDGLSED